MAKTMHFKKSEPAARSKSTSKNFTKFNCLRSRGRHVGWGVQDEFNDLWYEADLDEHQSE
jgi:hypothetical protein